MNTIIYLTVLLFVALATALPAPDGDTKQKSNDMPAPVAVEGEELSPEESRWGYGGWGRGYGGYGGYGRGYGGWGHGGYGGWGHGGYGRGYGYGGWNRGWGWGR